MSSDPTTEDLIEAARECAVCSGRVTDPRPGLRLCFDHATRSRPPTTRDDHA